MSTISLPDETTEDQRTCEIAAIFARAVLRLRKSQNALAFGTQKPLTGVASKSDAKQTDRQSATTPCRP